MKTSCFRYINQIAFFLFEEKRSTVTSPIIWLNLGSGVLQQAWGNWSKQGLSLAHR